MERIGYGAVNYSSSDEDRRHAGDPGDQSSDDSMETQAGGRRNDLQEGDRARARGDRGRFASQLTPMRRSVGLFGISVGQLAGGGLAIRSRRSDNATVQLNLNRRGVRLEAAGLNQDGEHRTALFRARTGRVTAEITDRSPRTERLRRNTAVQVQQGPNGPSATGRHSRRRSDGSVASTLMTAAYDSNAVRAIVGYGRSNTWNGENGPRTRSYGIELQVAADEVGLNTRFESEGLHGVDYLNAGFDGTLQFDNDGLRAEGIATAGVGLDVGNRMNLQSSLTVQAQSRFSGRRHLETATAGAIHTDRLTFRRLPLGIPGARFGERTIAVEGTYAARTGWRIPEPNQSWQFGHAPAPRAIENRQVEEVEESSSEERIGQ